MTNDLETDKQKEDIEKCYINGGWTYPCCKSEVAYEANIENPGENWTQIYCPYCSSYLEI